MIIIRDIEPQDHPACAAIFEAAWTDAFSVSPRTIGVAEFAMETKGEAVIVAVLSDRVCGFASIYLAESFLHHLYVDPAHHRHGIGSSLLHKAIQRAPDKLNLKCQHSNRHARDFYEAQGFVEGELGEDEYGLWVRLIAPY
ncbi:MAG: GNAT family N-acetyltransferase [Hyphomonadaceae bacterium]